MTIRYSKKVLFFALLIVAGFIANATPVLYQYNFENLPGNGLTATSPWTGTPDFMAAGLSNSSWATNYSAGFISFDGSCGNSSCQALSINHNNYPSTTTYTLTFDLVAGKELSITGLSFWDRESATGPKVANITINGTSAIVAHNLAGTVGANTGALTLANTFAHITGTVTVVITLSGATGTAGTFRLDDFVLNGSVNTPGINNYNVTGGGNYCVGDSGVAVGLDGSDTGVTYQLINSTIGNVGQPVAGTGSAISFGPQTNAGIYTVLATNDTGATGLMPDSITIILRQPPVVTLGTFPAQCSGSVTLDAGNPGSTYLWSDFSNQQTDVVGVSGKRYVIVTDTNGCSTLDSTEVIINTPPTLNFTASNLTICSGQASTITVDGANTYIWSNNLTTASITVQPDTSITYSVIATDTNGCTVSGNASLTVLPASRDTVTTQICQGESYNGHNQSGAFSDTLVAASVNGCDSIVTLYLQVLPVSNTVTTQTICSGQSFQGHSVSGTFADTLTSTITGCDSILTLQLTVSPAILTTINQTVCFGGSFGGHSASGTFNDTLPAAGGCDSVVSLNLVVLTQITTTVTPSICQGQNYQGHTATSNFTDTLHAVGGCDSIVTVNLTVNALPNPSLTLTFDTVCSNAATITLSGGSPAGGTYTGQGVSSAQFNPSAAPVGPDTIYYNYTDGNGCSATSYRLAHTEVCTGIENINSTIFSILPNPAQDYVVIENTGANLPGAINLYDMVGRQVISQPFTEVKTTLNIHQLPAGLYLLNITQGDSKVASFKIVKD